LVLLPIVAEQSATQHVFENRLPISTSGIEKRLTQGALQVTISFFKNKVILNPCQGCAIRFARASPFLLLNGGEEVSITAADVQWSSQPWLSDAGF
jgi:hypothetical protein